MGTDHQQVIGLLAVRGLASSADIQRALGRSQPTVSRLLAELSPAVLALGRARATRYGLPKSIRGWPAQQPIHWTDEQGRSTRVGTLSLLAGDHLHVDTSLVSSTTQGSLPWYLSPLQAQGFLGRLQARRLAGAGVEDNPERWNLETVLFAALQLNDAPGAFTLGDGGSEAAIPLTLPPEPDRLAAALDTLAADVAQTLPAGSSAGGEQPKFLAMLDGGQHVLVKFTPPRHTPFGIRWHDLLQAEALAAAVLADWGVEVAPCRLVQGRQRSHLISERFDRVGAHGRCHVVSVGAAHAAFVADAYSHWAASCEALTRQRRLPVLHAERAAALLQFGRLIGNTDMHAGNLGLRVCAEDLARGLFTLAPVYDMLPMRWRPDSQQGLAGDYLPFEPDARARRGPAAAPALAFWARLAAQAGVSRGLQAVAREMARRLASLD